LEKRDIEFREFGPSDALRPFVRCIWHLRGTRDATEMPEPIVPDGCVEIVINVADPFVRHDTAGSMVQPRAMVVGQFTRPVTVTPTGAIDVWGVRLHPWSAAAFLGVPSFELRDTIVRLDEILRDSAIVEQQLADGGGSNALVDVLERHARRVLRPEPEVRAAVETVTASHVLPSVRAMASHLGRTTRWVQRTFRDAVGLSPKMVLRLHRVQHAMRLATSDATRPWSRIAADTGYFDQSHLIRDFRQITGGPPSELRLGERGITEAFIGRDFDGRDVRSQMSDFRRQARCKERSSEI
jgi:AraC-like DNA-binding protein